MSALNFGALPDEQRADAACRRGFWASRRAWRGARAAVGRALDGAAAEALGLVTTAFDAVDWDDEVRVMLEERVSFSPDALTAMEANLRFAGPETMETRIFGRLTGVAELDLPAAERGRGTGASVRPGNASRRDGRESESRSASGVSRLLRSADATRLSRMREWTGSEDQMPDGMTVDYDGLIPNNVGLNDDARVRKALETWHPGYIDWWKDMGPEGFQDALVYLRTAVGVDPEGWAKLRLRQDARVPLGHPAGAAGRRPHIPFGAHKGEPVWQEVPGEHRAMLRRLLVIQGDTEPASVEQQRHLGATAPSLYDLRNLFQVNVEEGRHLWAMVYLLQKYFGRDGREEAEELLRRHSGDPDTPRMLGAFNERTPDWLQLLHVHHSSPTVTARCSSPRWRSPGSIRCRAPAASC